MQNVGSIGSRVAAALAAVALSVFMIGTSFATQGAFGPGLIA